MIQIKFLAITETFAHNHILLKVASLIFNIEIKKINNKIDNSTLGGMTRTNDFITIVNPIAIIHKILKNIIKYNYQHTYQSIYYTIYQIIITVTAMVIFILITNI